MKEKSDGWKSREWYGTTRTRQPAGSSGVRSFGDALEDAKPQGLHNLKKLMHLQKKKKRKSRGTKSGRESAKRKAVLYTMLGSAAADEKNKEKDRDKLGDKHEAFLEKKEEENEATCLTE